MAWSARVSAVTQSLEQTMRGAVGDWMQSLHNARPQYAQTATASALTGVITDPRTLGMAYPTFVEPEQVLINAEMLVPPVAGVTGDALTVWVKLAEVLVLKLPSPL